MRSSRLLLIVVLLTVFDLSTAFSADELASSPVELSTDWTEFDEEEEDVVAWDPLERVNRGMFWFNDQLYVYLLKPVARGYRAVIPKPGRKAVGNFFANLKAPVRVVNSLLQGKISVSLQHFERFLVNSSLGVGGLFDLYAERTQQPAAEDFGQTLGHYGIGSGCYLVLPLLGPSSLRDGLARLADRMIDPIPSPYYLKMHDYETWAATGLDKVNWLSLDRDSYEAVKEQALDPYLFIRNGYLQRMAAEVAR
ncbi:MAG: hypothetical protein C0614_06695 [Desulfuromonas sp.]|nr:MAG: hypothetical protein C0614_06695 [Desulfuromonas sp.]